jgi:hypothetical protein
MNIGLLCDIHVKMISVFIFLIYQLFNTLNSLRYTIEQFFQYFFFFRCRRDPITFQLYQRDFHEK